MTERARRAAEHRDAKRILVSEDARLPKLQRHDRPYEVWLDPRPDRPRHWYSPMKPWRIGKYRTLTAAESAKQAFQRPNTYWSDNYIVRIEKR